MDPPPDCKPLSFKWEFKRKRKVDGSIEKYEARLVIKGYKQTEGLSYFDTYSQMTRINSIRMVLAITRFSAPRQEKKVCKLLKSLYGLKQAPKQ